MGTLRVKRHGAFAVGLVMSLAPACRVNSAVPAKPDAGLTAASGTETPPSRASVLQNAGSSIADVADRVTPSVVNVFSERAVSAPPLSPFGDFFPFFFGPRGFGPPDMPERRERGLGSGVIIASDGVIVTNNHVVERADKVRVALKDGREFAAKIVGSDPKSDLAVLRVDAKDLPALPIANGSALRVGEVVLAIGNPFGVGQTVTMGIISAVGRANLGITDYEDFIQTDAAINPGNSGGALVNMQGELVGINTAIASRSGGYQGIGFAIPSSMVVQVKDAILRDGKVIRGWLGVAIQNIDEDLAKSLELTPRRGVLVSDVTPGAPAARAGLRRGDVILSVEGKATNDSAVLRNLIAAAGRNKKVSLVVLREGREQKLEVVLGEVPNEGTVAGDAAVTEQGPFAGASLGALDAGSRRRLRVPAELQGVVVTAVEPGSPAARLGLRPGDVIVEVNRRPTPNPQALEQAAALDARRTLALVHRDGSTLFLAVNR